MLESAKSTQPFAGNLSAEPAWARREEPRRCPATCRRAGRPARSSHPALASISAELLARAIEWTAKGFAALATGSLGDPGAFQAAANYFTAAGIPGGAGAAVAAIGAAVPGAKGGAQAGAAATPAGGTTAGTSPQLSGSTEAREGPMANVCISGPIYGGQEGLRELVGHISEAVNSADVVLHATSAGIVTARS